MIKFPVTGTFVTPGGMAMGFASSIFILNFILGESLSDRWSLPLVSPAVT